jgi:hypothetical protein
MRHARKPIDGKIVVEVICGINLNTLEVERVMVGRDGTLAKRERDGTTSFHKLGAGSSIEAEVRSFFNLTDLLSLPPGTDFDKHPDVVRLTRKAQELRQARQSKSFQPRG